MIVISGILLLVAVVCLVVGLFSSLVWVYISIGVSVVSFVFLLLGVRQRKELPVAEVASPTPDAGTSRLREALGADSDVTMVAPTPAAEVATAAPAAVPAAARTTTTATAAKPRSSSAIGEGGVLIVPGRPRYHVPGCRYLSGREIEPRSRDTAIDEGFTACGVCRPDEALAQAVAAEAAAPKPAARRRPAAEKAPAKQPATQPAKPPARQPAKAAPAAGAIAKAAPAKRTAAASAPRAETVVAIPERGKFHRPDCRYARGVASAQEMTKAQASRQGYQPCGTCKP